jgi:hypothetical protein
MPDENGSMGIIFKLVQDTSNQVMRLVRENGEIRQEMAGVTKNVSSIAAITDKIAADQQRILDSMRNKMTPERCVLFHDELRKTIRVELIDGVKGGFKTALTILKVAGWAMVAFGGAAAGAHQMGWLNSIIGGGN